MRNVDLNCDMGELPEAIADGSQEALMASITSVNIACGGHAGDEQTMRTTVEQAMRWKLAIGAHPGYADKKNFGRLQRKVPATGAGDCAAREGARLRRPRSGAESGDHLYPRGYTGVGEDRGRRGSEAAGSRRCAEGASCKVKCKRL